MHIHGLLRAIMENFTTWHWMQNLNHIHKITTWKFKMQTWKIRNVEFKLAQIFEVQNLLTRFKEKIKRQELVLEEINKQGTMSEEKAISVLTF